ncbi:hypothetical protein, partial [Sphingomonas sp. 10B4]|uniref:hypothetical protein n=1 Tax=Sphingomonas sp. 10B4 TaxID=3048575 RepID=UPI002B22AE38
METLKASYYHQAFTALPLSRPLYVSDDLNLINLALGWSVGPSVFNSSSELVAGPLIYLIDDPIGGIVIVTINTARIDTL